MQGLLLALVASAGVGIHVGETEHVSYQEVLRLVEEMAACVKARTQLPVIIDSADWEQCRSRGPCLDAVRTRIQTDDVVIVRVIAGPLSLAIASERFYADVDATRTSTASLSKNAEGEWHAKINGMVAQLFPEPPRIAAPPPPNPPPIAEEVPPPPREHSIAPWIVLGASGAAAAVGLGFGISNRVARHRLEGEVVTLDDRSDLESRARVHGIAATALFGTAAAGAITAFLLYAFE